MVARSPPKQRRVLAPLNPIHLRETLRKVDKCMERLQELQYTVAGGRKVISGVSLSPRSTRGYLRTSLRCKQETLRIKNSGSRRSPVGKFPASSGGEWRRMSLPAMLLGETVGEILEATQFARDIVAAVANKNPKKPSDDPKTPLTQQRKQRPSPVNTELRTRRKREKQLPRTEQASPPLQRARSRINFKVSPSKNQETEKENCRYLANRVSPRNRPWVRKTVLFPNPVFLNSPPKQQKFCRTGSPMAGRKIQTPHKFLIKSPPTSKFQVKIKSPPTVPSIPSPTRQANLSNKSPKLSTASKLRRSFSPSRLANKLVSPLKIRNKVQTIAADVVPNGLKQRLVLVPRRFSTGRM